MIKHIVAPLIAFVALLLPANASAETVTLDGRTYTLGENLLLLTPSKQSA